MYSCVHVAAAIATFTSIVTYLVSTENGAVWSFTSYKSVYEVSHGEPYHSGARRSTTEFPGEKQCVLSPAHVRARLGTWYITRRALIIVAIRHSSWARQKTSDC